VIADLQKIIDRGEQEQPSQLDMSGLGDTLSFSGNENIEFGMNNNDAIDATTLDPFGSDPFGGGAMSNPDDGNADLCADAASGGNTPINAEGAHEVKAPLVENSTSTGGPSAEVKNE
jgi:hypothetical protein